MDDEYDLIKNRNSHLKKWIKKKLNNSKTDKYNPLPIGHWRRRHALRKDKRDGNGIYRAQCKNKDILEFPHKKKVIETKKFDINECIEFGNKYHLRYDVAYKIFNNEELENNFDKFMNKYQNNKEVKFDDYFYVEKVSEKEILKKHMYYEKIFYISNIINSNKNLEIIDYYYSLNHNLFVAFQYSDEKYITKYSIKKIKGIKNRVYISNKTESSIEGLIFIGEEKIEWF